MSIFGMTSTKIEKKTRPSRHFLSGDTFVASEWSDQLVQGGHYMLVQVGEQRWWDDSKSTSWDLVDLATGRLIAANDADLPSLSIPGDRIWKRRPTIEQLTEHFGAGLTKTASMTSHSNFVPVRQVLSRLALGEPVKFVEPKKTAQTTAEKLLSRTV